jgi:SPFH domain / Band 7 family
VSDFLRLILDSIAYLWPFEIVYGWEKANYYICGKFWRTLRPGLKIKIPFFTLIETESVVPMIFVTPLQSIMLKDGGTLTFSATITLNVEDLDKALNKVDAWKQTATELTSGLLAEKLASTDATLFEPEKRGYLIGGCKVTLGNALNEYGVRVSALRFNNFIRNMRVYRIFNDQMYTNSD